MTQLEILVADLLNGVAVRKQANPGYAEDLELHLFTLRHELERLKQERAGYNPTVKAWVP